MTLSEFRKIKFNDVPIVILHESTYLAHRAFGPCNDKTKVFLYRHNDFFIEMFYSDTRQKFMMFSSFQGMRGLEPYLETISIDELTQLI